MIYGIFDGETNAVGSIIGDSMAVGFSQRIRDASHSRGDFSPFIRILTNDIIRNLSEHSIKIMFFQRKTKLG